MTDQRKQSLYFDRPMLAEIRREARRLDRPFSWMLQYAVRQALPQLRNMPSAPGLRDP